MLDLPATRSVVYRPGSASVAGSQLSDFVSHCSSFVRRPFASQADFHEFSVANYREFWQLFLEWSALLFEGEKEPVCTDDHCERAVFFPGLRLSYAENLLAGNDDSPALVAVHADQRPAEKLTRGALRERVARAAAGLRTLGLGPGDEAAAVLNNNIEAVVACLAVVAIGAGFSSAAPDMGASALLGRFGQLDPKVLIWQPDGGRLDGMVADLARALPSVKVLVPTASVAAADSYPVDVCPLPELLAHPPLTEFPRFPFNHRLFTMFSSGTTGKPKCIVHGAGGTLIEHLKEHRLHGDLRPADTLFFQTSCAWMMWNWQLSALATGARLVLYDGPVTGPETLWDIVADQQVTRFGTSPAYLKLCEQAGYKPKAKFPALRSLYSTGSVIYDEQFDWVARTIKHVPVQSISGGTDIIGCFVLGSPNLPVWRGEAQCRSLGMDVQAIAAPGAPYGELVCCNPFPSRPLGFRGDPDGRRFHAAYFSQNEGVWTHGDFVSFSPEGSARLYGRSDGVMNIRGIRVGPADIYAALQGMPELQEVMAVEQAAPAEPGGSRIVLLVVTAEGIVLDAALVREIRKAIARACSPAHVPSVIADVPALPVTHSGKRSESAARAAVNGEAVANSEALKNPECLEAIRLHPALNPAPAPGSDEAAGGGTIEEQVQAIWEQAFGFAPIAPDEDFFELGGHSVLAMVIFARVRERFGRDLPITVLLAAPTIASVAAILQANAENGFTCVVPVIPGEGRRLFLVHGLSGTVLELAHLLRALAGGRPVSVLQAWALDGVSEPDSSVEAMAEHYVEAIRAVQPYGPYALAGYSFGGLVAYEMARVLVAQGEEVSFVGLIDTALSSRCLTRTEALAHGRGRLALSWDVLTHGPAGARRDEFAAVRDSLMSLLGRHPPERNPLLQELPPTLGRVRTACDQAFAAYRPGPYAGRVHFFRAGIRDRRRCDPLPVWRRLAGVETITLPGSHFDLIRMPYAQNLATALQIDGAAPPDLPDGPLSEKAPAIGYPIGAE